MRIAIVSAARTFGVLAAGLLGVAAPAQAPLPAPTVIYPIKSQATVSPDAARPPADVGQIEVYNGARRSVYFVAPNLSPGDRASLRDLSRAESEAAYADDLLALKRQYVDSERALEPYRRTVQQQLYGFSTQSTYSGYVSNGFGGGYGGAYPYAFANPYSNGCGGGFNGYYGGASTTVSRSLANGVGDEGVIKAAMARELAAEANPEYATSVARGLESAYGRIATSDRLAKSFNLSKSNVVPAAATTPTRVILTLKGGDKVDGALYGEDSDWFRVETSTGTVSVRKSEVSRVEMPKK
jgi:hypothetical protein